MVGTPVPAVGGARGVRPPALVSAVARLAREERLFRTAKRILVAVSGGPDSIACLLALEALRETFHLELAVVHFDHMLRANSAEDMEFVRTVCAEREFPCFTGEGDVGGAARSQHRSMEEMARRMRYQFLAFVAAEKRFDAVATGHTADDQAETILMRIVRGTGVRGIRGILPASDLPGAPSIKLIRPLLTVSHAETLAFCAERGVTPMMDASNDDLALQRNRVRHETLTALRALNPSVGDALIGLGGSAREAFREIEKQSYLAVPKERGPVGAIFTRGALAGLQPEALGLVIEREAAFYRLEYEVNRRRITDAGRVLQSGAGEARFGDITLQASCGLVRLGPVLVAEPFEGRTLEVPGVTLARPWRVELAFDPLGGTAAAPVFAVDQSAAVGALCIRALQAGDRMLTKRVVRKLSDLLVNEKVPAWERIGAVAIADGRVVHALLTATRVFEADHAPEAELLYGRLSPAPARV